MTKAPIALFVYNRLDHTKKTVQALQKNIGAKESILYIFSDGPNRNSEKDVENVRKYIKSIKGFKEVIIKESKPNKGLAKSIIQGVTQVVNKHGKIIVLEDDLVTSKYFLEFMNYSLDKYAGDLSIYSISGYVFPPLSKGPLKLRRISSWGWATWQSKWQKAIWSEKRLLLSLLNPLVFCRFLSSGIDLIGMFILQYFGKINSWAVRWQLTHSIYNAFSIYPIKSYLTNIGMDNSGTHSSKTNIYKTKVTLKFNTSDKKKAACNFYQGWKLWVFFALHSKIQGFFKKW